MACFVWCPCVNYKNNRLSVSLADRPGGLRILRKMLELPAHRYKSPLKSGTVIENLRRLLRVPGHDRVRMAVSCPNPVARLVDLPADLVGGVFDPPKQLQIGGNDASLSPNSASLIDRKPHETPPSDSFSAFPAGRRTLVPSG